LLLSFKEIQKANPTAIDLLYLFAFLAPDDIPEELVSNSAHVLSPALQAIVEHPDLFDDAIGELLKYSLIRRIPDMEICTIHILVQTCVKDAIDEQTRREWAKRAVGAVSLAYPDTTDVKLWEQCERYLPH